MAIIDGRAYKILKFYEAVGEIVRIDPRDTGIPRAWWVIDVELVCPD